LPRFELVICGIDSSDISEPETGFKFLDPINLLTLTFGF
jgi:hypothetical protein